MARPHFPWLLAAALAVAALQGALVAGGGDCMAMKKCGEGMDAAALAGAATEALAGSKLAALPAKQMEFEIEVPKIELDIEPIEIEKLELDDMESKHKGFDFEKAFDLKGAFDFKHPLDFMKAFGRRKLAGQGAGWAGGRRALMGGKKKILDVDMLKMLLSGLLTIGKGKG